MSDIAIAHDQFRTMGGAERVAVEAARTLDAPIYAMRVDENVPPDDVTVHNLSSRKGQWIMRRHYLLQDMYQMLAWQHVPELYEYDTILLTKNNPSWFVPHADTQTVIKYTHSTPRGMFDQFHRRGGGVINDAMKTIMRILYKQNVTYPDHWLCNSEIVKRRVKMYADPAEADVRTLYPPVNVSKTHPQMAETQDYYFAIGRMDVNKRIGLLRDVAEYADKQIVVAGTGPEKDKLLSDKPDNLEYLGHISNEEKWGRYSEAKATLMLAENEDFGIVPIESMAAGTPVIGVNEGYTKHQIKYGKNGLLRKPAVLPIQNGMEEIERNGVKWTENQIAEFAQQFSKTRFARRLRETVTEIEEQATVTPNHRLPAEVKE